MYNYLEGSHYFGFQVSDPDNFDAPINADSLPTFAVYELGYGSSIKTGTMVAGPVTGSYYGTFTRDAASGFEKGKCYRIISSATLNTHVGHWEEWFEVDFDPMDLLTNTVNQLNQIFGGTTVTWTIDDLYNKVMTAVQLRTAVGLATGNLDTQLDALPTAAENATQLVTQSASTPVKSDLKRINNTVINGNGTTVPFGP